MSAPTATWSKERLPALRLVESSLIARRLANTLLIVLAVSIVAMLFVPWQQSARGTGKVVAFVPQERQQSVSSPVKGIVRRIGEGMVEGAEVKRGDFIAEVCKAVLSPTNNDNPHHLGSLWTCSLDTVDATGMVRSVSTSSGCHPQFLGALPPLDDSIKACYRQSLSNR